MQSLQEKETKARRGIGMTNEEIKHLNHDIGVLVWIIRKRLGMRQTEMAKLLGLDQSALSRVENGRQELSAWQWLELTKLQNGFV